MFEQHDILNIDGYRKNNKLYISKYHRFDELGAATYVDSENKTRVDKYAEIVASSAEGVILFIPASQFDPKLTWFQPDSKAMV